MAKPIDDIARQIAAHVYNGDIDAAKDLFNRAIEPLKHFEASALRDAVHFELKMIEGRRKHND